MPKANGLFNPSNATPAMQRAVRSVCAIVSGPHSGTGVLIGPDLVLTACHVVQHVLTPEDYGELRCIFDYVADGSGATNSGTEVGVLAGALCRSLPSPGDMQGGAPTFLPDCLDFAIIRLASPIGRRPTRDGLSRGWLQLPKSPDLPDNEDEIFLYQHPTGENFQKTQQPLRCGRGNVDGTLGDNARFVHTAESRPGSSGGPCFDMDKEFAFVGLHNSGHRSGDNSQKRFVPLLKIVPYIRHKFAADGLLQEFFQDPPSLGLPDGARDAEVARRRNAALWLMDRMTEEIRFRRTAAAKPAAPAMPLPRVHLIACRDDDLPEFFTKRLEFLPLYPTHKLREDAILTGLAQGELARSFDGRVEGWPTIDHADRRKAEIDVLVSDLDVDGRQLLVLKGDYTDGMDATTERELMAHLASALHARVDGTPGTLLCLVCLTVDHTRPDAAAIIESFAGLWNDASAPPGCGLCIQLSDIGLADLTGWRVVIETAWGENQVLRREMESLFRNQTRLRMKRVVDELGDDIDLVIRSSRPAGQGRQP
ncbi:serine protease [Alsobacter sp. KACC 23698]|uniref:Serine protease n=1 Tax=Alsobacter sp. KACC 23698 TaxID=3149229 RepID=A0AAU7JBN7_9HYPH